MNRKLVLLFFSLVFTLQTTRAQVNVGTIRGTVRDGQTKEALIGCTIRIDGTQLGVTTDVEGNFLLTNVPVGNQKVIISYISYQTKEIPNVRVESGNTTAIETELLTEGKALQEVVVRGNRATNTEVAVITEIKQMKPIAVGISAQQIVKSQDRDAAAAIRRVPGVSIVDNRFVLIRGLAARYNSVLINDVITPSTEVDTRSFSFDLVPSNIIDRMIVFKSGSSELPGDFAGGVIKIYTKRRPDQNFMDAGLTLGYRANTTFQTVQTQTRSGLNWLGLWGADQQIPSSFPTKFGEFNSLNPLQRAAYAQLLPNSWGLKNYSVTPDIRFALNLGRRFDVGAIRFSNLTSINYASTNQFSNIDFKLYDNGTIANAVAEQYNDANYARQSRLGVLHNWTARFSPGFTLEWKTLFNQLSITETVVRSGQRVQDGFDVRSFSERFENRSILTSQVSGEHSVSDLTKFNWIASFGYTGRWEPDWKRVRYQRVTGATGADGQLQTFSIATPNDPNPIDVGRFYSKLHEYVVSAIGNGEHTFGNPTDREPNRIRFGVYAERKNRDYSARFYGYQSVGNSSVAKASDINNAFSPANVNGQNGFSLLDGTKPLDSYKGINTYLSGYITGDVYFGPKANLTLGFRGEYNDQGIRATRTTVEEQLVSNKVFSPLPSLNFTYKLSDRTNLRLAYSSSVNRPEFRELAPFSYFDFNLLADIRGNTALKTANIQNIDAKWEFYPTPNELISVTGFYKHFTNPIESFLLIQANGLAYTFANANSAQNYGVELEVRKGFPNSSSVFLQNLSVVGNVSLIKSQVNVGDIVRAPDLSGEVREYDIRGIADTQRPLAGQSPYLINAGLYYAAPKSGWQANILYNVFGQRIFAVGNRNNPTIYEMPRNVVDLNVTKLVNKKLELRLGIQDLLNQYVRFVQDFNHDGKIGSDVTSQTADADQTIRRFKRGSYYTLSAVYTFGRRTIIP
ncbi:MULTISPECIES: TonB-dependent receptor [unclassified Spirosoma]|uniref:TonB-dependent receptor n=1 Tax=unclassified Spirosoma TaxID=2621999 RepID=UPI00095D8AC9|nr:MULTISPECIES: TonB-dependent receptor [unclassified Spirosoma]MBN8820652.1 TonB-dependent receptor [Spirosoma sp.]OJW78027.1 MAG: TonB-dependent receptor [Spirosoma sp. 48-14]